MQTIRYFFLPLSLIYKVITSLRNLLFDFKIYNSYTSNIPSVGIGNITAGGTGKTPVVISLIEHFNDKNIAVVSRGYGRKTKGLLKVDENCTPAEVGDEPFMIFKNFKKILFLVSEKRKIALQHIETKYPLINLVIFDDVFQHRHIEPKVNVLLCDYERPFFKDFVLPLGMLRESRSGAKRAQIVLVTKCPQNIALSEKKEIIDALSHYSDRRAKIFFSTFINETVGLAANTKIDSSKPVILISAIGNNQSFKKSLSDRFKIEHHFSFPDHHFYTFNDISLILKKYPHYQFITTEKDIIKIEQLLDNESKKHFFVSKLRIQYLEKDSFFEEIKIVLQS